MKTLQELEIGHKFVVVDHLGAGFGGGSGGGAFRCGIRRLPAGFPPIGLYRLIDYAGEGCVLVAKGPHNLYYSRTVVPSGAQVGWGLPPSHGGGQRERLEYLDAFTQRSATQAFRAASTIWWRDQADFERQVDVGLEGQAGDIQVFVDQAKQKGVEGLAGLRLKIVPEIEDQRQDGTAALPAIAPKELVLR